MTRGIVYLLNGLCVAERLAVSIHSLRDHWSGPITIMVRTDEEWNLAHQIACDICCSVEQFKFLDERAMLSKTQIPEWAPYEETLFLDADTVVVGSLDDLFGCPLTLTKCAEWRSNRRLTAGWIRRWKDHIDREDFLEMIDVQLNNPYPAINTGVFAFQRDNTDLAVWKMLAFLNPGAAMVDQTAMQILTSAIPHRLLDDRYNNSIIYGLETADIRLIHYHGRKHFLTRSNWPEFFLKTMEANIGGIQDWAGKHDRRVRKWLQRRQEC